MAIKTITWKEEIRVCDICGQPEDPSKRLRIEVCSLCKKDICPYCGASVHFSRKLGGGEANAGVGFLCQAHLPRELFVLAEE